MKTISLWQPWASAIAAGLKTIETRSWETKYRGPLAIHASKRWTNAERLFWLEHVSADLPENIENRDAFRKIGILDGDLIPKGVIVATCEIYACISTNEDPMLVAPDHISGPTEHIWGNYGPDRFGWLLRNVQILATPVPCVGRQGFFDWTP